MSTAGETPGWSRRLFALVPVALFGALAILLLIRLFAGDASKLPSALIGRSVPAFSLPSLTGLERIPGLSDADLRGGEVTVVNFFASWCIPCHQEHPSLTELARGGVRLVGIAYKDDPENTRRFLGSKGNPYSRIGVDRSGRAGIEFGVSGVPETFVVRGDGTIAYKHFGPVTGDDLADKLLPAVRAAGGP